VNVVLDAGALTAVDRDDRRALIAIEIGRRPGGQLVTTAPVVGQAWRGGSRQARLARLLGAVGVRPAALPNSREAGELLAVAGTSDVVDALVAGLALPGDQILTNDPDDIRRLVEARGLSVIVVGV
jgi:predicted membrane GTPase involved in stress response